MIILILISLSILSCNNISENEERNTKERHKKYQKIDQNSDPVEYIFDKDVYGKIDSIKFKDSIFSLNEYNPYLKEFKKLSLTENGWGINLDWKERGKTIEGIIGKKNINPNKINVSTQSIVYKENTSNIVIVYQLFISENIDEENNNQIGCQSSFLILSKKGKIIKFIENIKDGISSGASSNKYLVFVTGNGNNIIIYDLINDVSKTFQEKDIVTGTLEFNNKFIFQKEKQVICLDLNEFYRLEKTIPEKELRNAIQIFTDRVEIINVRIEPHKILKSYFYENDFKKEKLIL